MVDDGDLQISAFDDVKDAAAGVDAAHPRRRPQQDHHRIQPLPAPSARQSRACTDQTAISQPLQRVPVRGFGPTEAV